MGVSIKLPESENIYSARRRRFTSRPSRKILNAALLVFILLFWFLGGLSWTDFEDGDSGIEVQATGAAATQPVMEIDLGTEMGGVKNLVIVTCHAIWLGGPTAGEDEAEWAIEPFQKGETKTFIQHIERGIEIALQDSESLLVFSGGETKASAGPRSEADGYFDLAAARGLLPSSLLARTTTEESATDSYQNVLFSIARFHEVTGIYPASITVISHDFKRERFQQLHRASLQYPEEQFQFVGIDPDWEKVVSVKEQIVEYEGITRKAWERDPYACAKNGELRAKRRGRNPWRRFHSYTTSCPELAGLLAWCGLGETSPQLQFYPGVLPWLD